MAFSGDLLVAGNYHGFNAYRLGANGVPQLVSSTVCPGWKRRVVGVKSR